MTDLEAHTMYEAVKSARHEGWKVPTCKTLASLLHRGGQQGDISPGQAKLINDRLLKLQGEHHFLRKKRKKDHRTRAWYVHTKTLVTEPDTALYLITLVDVCTLPDQDRIPKETFHATLASNGFSQADVDRIFPQASRNGYIEEIGSDLRPGEKAHSQLPYLRLLATDFKPKVP